MNPTTSTNESVIARIQKLMAMAARSQGNEHEAAVAASRIQEILTAYNLDMAEVESATAKGTGTGTGVDDPTSTKRTKESHVKSAMYTYQQSLMKALARNNFCDHWISDSRWKDDPRGKHTRYPENPDGTRDYSRPIKGRYVKVHMLLGREVNVIVTRMTYDYLVETMDRLLPYQGMEKRGKDALLWLSGCTDRLVERLDEQRREKEESMKTQAGASAGFVMASGQSSGTGGALVRLTDLYTNESELNQDFRRGVEPGTTTRERLEYEAGQRAIRVEQQRLIDEEGMSHGDAWHVARGYDIPNKEAVTVKESETETPSQARKRAARESRSNDRYWERQERKEQKEQEKKSSSAYRDGHHVGRSIGLDAQVKDKGTGKSPSTKREELT